MYSDIFFRQCCIILPLVLNWFCPGCPRVRPSAVWSAGRSLSWSSHPGAHLVVDKQEKARKRWASDLILLSAFFCHQPQTLCLFMTDGHLCCYGRKNSQDSSPWSNIMSGWILVSWTTIVIMCQQIFKISFVQLFWFVESATQEKPPSLVNLLLEKLLRLLLPW